MYGGLFGDLPSTKNSSKKEEENNGDSSRRDDESKEEDAPKSASGADNAPASKKRPGTSIVSGLGSSGTSMAFVPTALRQKKRPSSSSTPVPAAVTRKPPPPTNQEQVLRGPSEVVQVHEPHRHIGDSQYDDDTPDAPMDGHSSLPELETESEEMRKLHASVNPEDVYDPHVPNDLLAYWDRKAMEKERLELEREARETLERQQHLREQLDREREAANKTGDVAQIAEQRSRAAAEMGRGRGRGRGVSNLPAWLVQQQKDRVGEGDIDSSLAAPAPKPSSAGRTVVLSNLTAPGELDDELADEVREECEEQCGPVTSVTLHDAQPPLQPAVQVHVDFAAEIDATRCVQIFHGRHFGERRITAELKPVQR